VAAMEHLSLSGGREEEEEGGEAADFPTEDVDGEYILFHDVGHDVFKFTLFGEELSLKQKPSSRDLGHGAVVWESSAIFSKYMEINFKKFNHTKLTGRTVLELGSGCGLGGLAFMMRGAAVIMTDLACVVDELTRENAEVCAVLCCAVLSTLCLSFLLHS
jgi:predicted nicotinamide N-methyase